MSTQQRLKQMIYEIMQDHQKHTLSELQKEAVKRNILSVNNTTAIRNAIFSIKKEDPLFTSPQKGEYLLVTAKSLDNDFSFAVEIIHTRITELQRFNWMTCSDLELENARDDIISLKKLDTAIFGLL